MLHAKCRGFHKCLLQFGRPASENALLQKAWSARLAAPCHAEDDNDFQQYLFTAGVTDDGIGEPLPEFIAFAIKIVGQGTNAAEPIRIRDLRVIALAT